MLAESTSLTRFWLHDVELQNMRRHWEEVWETSGGLRLDPVEAATAEGARS
jgi:hypothetical protein